MTQRRVGILISGGGSNMVALVRSMGRDHPAKPVLVLSNVADAAGLTRAAELGVPTAVVDHRDFDTREAFDAAVDRQLEEAGVDLLCLAGFMRIFTPGFTRKWEGRCLNIHPSLLPDFRGLHTHERALEAGVKTHGCSVHEVTAELDAGPILGQGRLAVRGEDTPDSLAARVLKLEHRLYPAVLKQFAAGDRSPISLAEP